jgi:hypothetical protein
VTLPSPDASLAFTGASDGTATYSTSTGTLTLGAAAGATSYYFLLKPQGAGPSYVMATASNVIVLPTWLVTALGHQLMDIYYMMPMRTFPSLDASGLSRTNQSIPDFKMAYESKTSSGMGFNVLGIQF